MYTQFNTLSFCIDVDDSYTTYLSGFNVNMSVNDSYLLMRTKHVFASSIVYSNLLQFITYFKKLVSIVFFMGRRYEENFCLILLSESYYFEWIILFMLKYINHSSTHPPRWVKQHFCCQYNVRSDLILQWCTLRWCMAC